MEAEDTVQRERDKAQMETKKAAGALGKALAASFVLGAAPRRRGTGEENRLTGWY